MSAPNHWELQEIINDYINYHPNSKEHNQMYGATAVALCVLTALKEDRRHDLNDYIKRYKGILKDPDEDIIPKHIKDLESHLSRAADVLKLIKKGSTSE